MNRRPIFLLALAPLVLMTAAGAASAKDVFVAPWGIDGLPNTGLSIADPFRSISFSLSAASGLPLFSGDRILVLPGTYDAASGEIFPIMLPTGVSLIGVGGPFVTTLIPGGLHGIQVFGPNTTATMVTGFSIVGGGYGIWTSGGIPVPWPTSPPFPAGVAPLLASPTIADNVIVEHSVGIMANTYYGPNQSRVRDNLTLSDGFGMVSFANGISTPYLEASVADNNTFAYSYSVGFECNGTYATSYPLLRSNLSVFNSFAGFSAVGGGPGTYYGWNAYPINFNSTSANNLYGFINTAGLYSLNVTVNGLFFYNIYDHPLNPAAVYYVGTSDIGPTTPLPAGLGNFSVPPAFVPGTFSLSAASPCIDQGNNFFFFSHKATGESFIGTYDVYGDNRIINYPGIVWPYYPYDIPQIDVGADEFPWDKVCLTGTVNTGGPCGPGTGGGPIDTVFVNGSSGGNGRSVVVSTNDVVAVSLVFPPAGALLPTKYIVNGWVGTPPGPVGFVWPKNVGLGCFPIFPAAFVANTAKPTLFPSTPEATGCKQPCVVLDIPPGLPIGTIWTFQGITTDAGGPGSAAGGTVCASVTNGVILTVGP